MSKQMMWRSILLLLTVAVLVLFYVYEPAPSVNVPDPAAADERVVHDEATRPIAEAFAERRSGLMVEATGVVEKILADDREGSQHQRFIVRLPSGQTLLISHNIDLAARIPLSKHDSIDFRGQYEWNERGGVVHWTHHDPQRRRAGGWIRHQGETYR